MILWSKISSFILMNKVSQLSFLYRCHQTLCDQSEAGWGSVRDGMERRRSCQTHFSLHLRGNRVAHCPRSGICFQKFMVGMESNARQFLYLKGDAASKFDLRKEVLFFCNCDYKSYMCNDRALCFCVYGLRMASCCE